MSGYGEFRDKLLGKPDVTGLPFCAVCGRPARDQHHVVEKGIGGTKLDADIPLVRLCGGGNTSGCHGRLHSHILHIYWESEPKEGLPGWVFLFTREPMDDMECWKLNRASYLPLPGWVEQQSIEEHVFGGKAPSTVNIRRKAWRR